MSKKYIEFDELYPLPEGWEWVPLEGLMATPKQDIVDGPFGSNLKASEYTDEGVPIARLQNIDRNQFIYQNIKFVSEEKAEYLDRHNFRPGDILITKLGYPLGEACIAPDKISHGIIVADLVRVRVPVDGIDRKYLTYAINSPFLVRQFEKHTKGTTRPRVNLGVIRELPIPVAPREQQKRIVAEIEKQFSRLDEAVANLKRVKANLKRYKAAVLKAAVEGKLTEEWRKSHVGAGSPRPGVSSPHGSGRGDRAPTQPIETGAELLERILAERREKWQGRGKYKEPVAPDTSGLPELPEGWVWASVEEVALNVVDCPHSTPKWADEGKICVRTTEFEPGRLNLASVRYVSPETYEIRNARLVPKPGDILYSREGGILGIACEIPSGVDLCLGQRMLLIRPSDVVRSTWVMNWLNSQFILQRVRGLTGGSASPHLNLRDIRSFPIPLPSLAEQHQIVAEVERRLSIVAEAEAQIDANLRRAERLRQSILKQAFSGRLIPPDCGEGGTHE